ncbi:RNA methyltransferase [Desulfacinum hydrothermale]|uniref:RNA methyltransferase n=1 Tax=Desulfacinum hydrothermale TaxID=109258 RepID=UPI001FE89AAC
MASAVTNLDLHDLARLACTYDLPACYVVTPLKDQQELVKRLTHHWFHNVGKELHPDREKALRRLRLAPSVEAACAEIRQETGKDPILWATSARRHSRVTEPAQARGILEKEEVPGMLLLGTGWGLAPSVLDLCAGFLPPIEGRSQYNHLSVRSAASILVDRFFGQGACIHG